MVEEIERRSGNPELKKAEALSSKIKQAVNDTKHTISSILTIFLAETDDGCVRDAKKKVESERLIKEHEAMRAILPTGQFLSRDRLAMSQGMRVAPHQAVTGKTALIGARRW